VFKDNEGGVGWNVSVIYNPYLDRYLLVTEHGATASGHIGIFEAPEPWGPWRTVLYEDSFGAGQIEQSTFFWNFAPKWWRNNGKDFTLVFTGTGSNDSWNTVNGSFILGDSPLHPANQPPQAEANGPYSTKVGENISFSSSGSSDPDGLIVSYHWDFGDGNTSNQANPIHSYSQEGIYTVTLTVTDEQGDQATDTTQVIITNIPSEGFQIANITVSTNNNYQTAFLAVGSKYYIDRTYTLTSIPDYLQGVYWIKTANSDKAETTSNFLSFTVNQPATVYIGYDKRINTLPNWLQSFEKINDVLIDDQGVTFQLYKKTFSRGTITLGANQGMSDSNMYTIALVSSDASSVKSPDDILDLVNLLQNWGTTDPQTNLDGKGKVDIFDLLLLLQQWGQ
jgi:PKD repeat protein